MTDDRPSLVRSLVTEKKLSGILTLFIITVYKLFDDLTKQGARMVVFKI
jgi:hypothetical protein